MMSIGKDKNTSTSNANKTIGGSVSNGILAVVTNAMMINSANQLTNRTNVPMLHHTTLYSSAPNASVPYGPASSLRHIPTLLIFAQPYSAPFANRPRDEDIGLGNLNE